MTNFNSPLNNIKIADPCKADWEKMTGNEQVRFCGQCNLNVYNLSNMTKDAAEELVRKTEGRLCVRFYRRADGTILTENCPVGFRALKQRLSKVATAAIAAALSFFTGLGLAGRMQTDEHILQPTQSNQPLYQLNPPVRNLVVPVVKPSDSPSGPVMGEAMMGKMVMPSPQPIEMGSIAAPPTSGCRLPKNELPPPPTNETRPPFIRRSEGVIRGMMVSNLKPEYPAIARTARVSGDVVVEVMIDEAGAVASTRVISGHPLLQQAAVNAVRQWRFKPSLINGEATKVQGVLTIRFTL